MGGHGVIDAAGASATLQMALDWVWLGGWISEVGRGRNRWGGNLDALRYKNVTLLGSFSHHWALGERAPALLGRGQLM